VTGLLSAPTLLETPSGFALFDVDDDALKEANVLVQFRLFFCTCFTIPFLLDRAASDCFSFLFAGYLFWGVIKEDLLTLFHEFHKKTIDLFSLNFGINTLISKIENAAKIESYRPICVLNVSFKIFTKVGTNRLNKVAKTVASPTQTAFMPGRNIMEGVVILHETIHELHTRKANGVIFKIDFEKDYDKVKWSFLQQTLRMKGFSPKWCRWIQNMVTGGGVGIDVNDDIGPYFQTKWGPR
jgi:hypothetical protein